MIVNKYFTIKSENFNDENIYQKDPELNKMKLNRNFIRYSELMQGGQLKFNMMNQESNIPQK